MIKADEDKKDYFWFYIGGITAALVVVLIMVKLNEDEKFAPIKERVSEELQQMNIRVIKSE